MAKSETCGGEFREYALYTSGFLLVPAVLAILAAYGDPKTWYICWAWSWLTLALLLPVFPNLGAKMCFAIAHGMSVRRMLGVTVFFGALCVIIYHAFTKLGAILLAGLLVVLVLLAVCALLLRRKKTEPELRPMEFIPTLFAIMAYVGSVVLVCGGLLASAIEVGKITVVTPPPALEMSLRMETRRVQNLGDLRGEIHVHSKLSHDSRGTFNEIASAAVKNDVRWVILTDHISSLPEAEYLPKGPEAVTFIYGSERDWKKQGSHFRAPLDSPRQLHFYGHTELLKEWDGEYWDAIELVNYHANALEKKWKLLGKAFVSPWSLYEELNYLRPENLQRWQELAEREGRPIPIFAGPDAHQNVRVLGAQADPYALIFRGISTHIWYPYDKPLSERAILDTIKAGRTYIAFDSLGDPKGFQFWAENEAYWFFTGETVRAPARLIVKPPPTTDCETRIYRDNQLVVKREPGAAAFCDLTVEKPPPGFWRTEIWRFGKPWVISGQILVK